MKPDINTTDQLLKDYFQESKQIAPEKMTDEVMRKIEEVKPLESTAIHFSKKILGMSVFVALLFFVLAIAFGDHSTTSSSLQISVPSIGLDAAMKPILIGLVVGVWGLLLFDKVLNIFSKKSRSNT
ncbi:hypothetical protein [Sediminitomix flava]|uniref:Uncharacterized protein n=1 Tax=Sediminitomix flava TaxID=379075 RepID=A0A315Z612_SEDFL|nr:hypothetical protein [Sediminitomix flava]PWJ39152.1 hypothetical protein BC781_10653 [Sediminitomix flava]